MAKILKFFKRAKDTKDSVVADGSRKQTNPAVDEVLQAGLPANALETVPSLSTQSDGAAAGSSVDGAGAGGSTPAPIRMAVAAPATENGISWKSVIIAVLLALVVTVPAIILVGQVLKLRVELNRNVEALETLKQEISQLKGLLMNQSCQAPAPSMPSTATGGNGVGGGRTSGDFAAINMNEPLMVPLELVNWLVSTGPLIESEDKMVDAPVAEIHLKLALLNVITAAKYKMDGQLRRMREARSK